MASKRASNDASDRNAGSKRGRKSLADSVDVTAVMSSEGPIVTVVMLRANGVIEELVLDMSPKLQLVAKELGSSVGFLGQWETLEVVLVIRADQDDEKIAISTQKLQPPFHDASVRGDIMLMRNNEDGIPIDFSLKEYQTFQQLLIEKWEPVDGNGDVNSAEESGEDDDEEEEEDGEEGEDDDEEEEDNDEELTIFDYMREDELTKFRAANSREPTEEEFKVINETATTMAQEMSNTMEESEEETDEEGGQQMEQFIEQIYGRLVQKFETDNDRPPTEEECEPLREQAGQYAEQIIATNNGGNDDEEDEEDEEEDEDGEQEEEDGEEGDEEADEGEDGAEEKDDDGNPVENAVEG